MTVCEIAEKLRQLNRWRRGDDETLIMPDPAAIGRWIDAAADALELRDNRAARVAELEAALREALHALQDYDNTREDRIWTAKEKITAALARHHENQGDARARAESAAPKEVLP